MSRFKLGRKALETTMENRFLNEKRTFVDYRLMEKELGELGGSFPHKWKNNTNLNTHLIIVGARRNNDVLQTVITNVSPGGYNLLRENVVLEGEEAVENLIRLLTDVLDNGLEIVEEFNEAKAIVDASDALAGKKMLASRDEAMSAMYGGAVSAR